MTPELHLRPVEADAFMHAWMQVGIIVHASIQKKIEPSLHSVEHNAEPAPLIRGPFQLDVAERVLEVKQIGFRVPSRFMPVLQIFLDAGSERNCGRGWASYVVVAAAYQRGLLEEKLPTANEKVINEKLAARSEDIRLHAAKISQQFARDFYRWLRKEAIDPSFVIRCDRTQKIYRLGKGWHPSRPLKHTGKPYYVSDEAFNPKPESTGESESNADDLDFECQPEGNADDEN